MRAHMKELGSLLSSIVDHTKILLRLRSSSDAVNDASCHSYWVTADDFGWSTIASCVQQPQSKAIGEGKDVGTCDTQDGSARWMLTLLT